VFHDAVDSSIAPFGITPTYPPNIDRVTAEERNLRVARRTWLGACSVCP
jgi:hypothetical protein